MKKGDKVRFLSEVGGGKVAGFQGKNIVLVEDEDGFEIPMPINEVVVVEQDEYSMGKMISAENGMRSRRLRSMPIPNCIRTAGVSRPS